MNPAPPGAFSSQRPGSKQAARAPEWSGLGVTGAGAQFAMPPPMRRPMHRRVLPPAPLGRDLMRERRRRRKVGSSGWRHAFNRIGARRAPRAKALDSPVQLPRPRAEAKS